MKLQDLPDDVLAHIAIKLSPKNAAKLSTASSNLRKIGRRAHPDLHKGQASYRTGTGKLQTLYDTMDSILEHQIAAVEDDDSLSPRSKTRLIREIDYKDHMFHVMRSALEDGQLVHEMTGRTFRGIFPLKDIKTVLKRKGPVYGAAYKVLSRRQASDEKEADRVMTAALEVFAAPPRQTSLATCMHALCLRAGNT